MTTVAADIVQVPHVLKGETVLGADVEHQSGSLRFATPKLDLDQLVWSRLTPGPAFDVPTAEIVDLLQATSDALRDDAGGYLSEALERLVPTSSLGRPMLERMYADMWRKFQRPEVEFQLDNELGGAQVLDGWRPVRDPNGRTAAIRAFPPRLVHVLAGNAPGVGPQQVVRGALTKGVHLLKLPSNDLFTTPAVLRAMAQVAPGHPVVRSFSVAYWRGGDDSVESVLFRPQFFDKVVAWGGEATIRGVLKYIGPGFELVSFDPKTSISLVGREAFETEDALAEAVDAAATDATFLNQEACVASRFLFVEGTTGDVDRFCEALLPQLSKERPFAAASGSPVPGEIREEIDVLKDMAPFYRVWGSYDGTGTVIRSDDPVEFHPIARVVNVVPVTSLSDAVRFADVATQTVGVYPASRKVDVRDALASAGVQRVVVLGHAGAASNGLAHDGFIPLHRFMRWVNDEDPPVSAEPAS
jgi:hypothetical protein